MQQIYKYENGALKLVTANPVLSGIRGMAVSGDGRTLYFADEALGLFGIDLAQGKPFNVVYDQNKLALGGIDGLYWFDGTLVAIQNGMSPKRVMRLRLGSDGRSIVQAQPLDAAQPAFGLPTVGTVSNQALYFIANSQRGLYNDLGVLTDADKLEPVHIFRTDLLFAWNQQAPKMPMPPPHRYTPEELKKMLTERPKGFIPQPSAEPAPTATPPEKH